MTSRIVLVAFGVACFQPSLIASDCSGCTHSDSCLELDPSGSSRFLGCYGTFSRPDYMGNLCADPYESLDMEGAKDYGLTEEMCSSVPSGQAFFLQQTGSFRSCESSSTYALWGCSGGLSGGCFFTDDEGCYDVSLFVCTYGVTDILDGPSPNLNPNDYYNFAVIDGTVAGAICIAPPTVSPTDAPTGSTPPPTAVTDAPSDSPTKSPSDHPSMTPSRDPTNMPSISPSDFPTNSPTIRPTKLPSIVPTALPSKMPSITPSNMPSFDPTLDPSDAPSEVPSNRPSATPSIVPSNFPSDFPSIVPTILPTYTILTQTNFTITRSGTAISTSSEDSQGGAAAVGADAEEYDEDALEAVNSAATGIFWILCACGLMVALLFGLGRKFVWKIADIPNYGALMIYIQNVCDFWTDVLFCATMQIKGEFDYFIWSAVFTGLPLLSSVGLLIYWTNYWRSMSTNVDFRIKKYLDKYGNALVVFSVFGTFSSAVSLIQSRVFANPMFSFPLKKREHDEIRIWRLINTTLVENIPQLVIQASYLANSDASTDDNIIVFLSIVLTILSLLVSLSQTCIIILSLKKEHNSKVLQKSEIESKLMLKSDNFTSEHAYCHNSIEECIFNVLERDDSLLTNHTDCSLNAQVYFIDDQVAFTHEIHVFFSLILTSYAAPDISANSISYGARLEQSVNNLGTQGSALHSKLESVLRTKLKCDNLTIVSNEILSANTASVDHSSNFLQTLGTRILIHGGSTSSRGRYSNPNEGQTRNATATTNKSARLPSAINTGHIAMPSQSLGLSVSRASQVSQSTPTPSGHLKAPSQLEMSEVIEGSSEEGAEGESAEGSLPTGATGAAGATNSKSLKSLKSARGSGVLNYEYTKGIVVMGDDDAKGAKVAKGAKHGKGGNGKVVLDADVNVEDLFIGDEYDSENDREDLVEMIRETATAQGENLKAENKAKKEEQNNDPTKMGLQMNLSHVD